MDTQITLSLLVYECNLFIKHLNKVWMETGVTHNNPNMQVGFVCLF